jgi:N-acetylmuramoyl-L-alanine amidase
MSHYRKRRRLHPNFLLGCVALALIVFNAALLLRRDTLPADGVILPKDVETEYLPMNPYSRPGTPLEEIRGVVIHYVGNPDTSAMANRSYFASLALTGETYASSHFIVGLEGEVVACVPLTEVAYASNERNDDTVSIEVCHADDTGKYSPETYEAVVELTAWLCGTFGLEAEEDVIRHYDVTGKICPKYYVEHPEAWEQLKADVAQRCAAQKN